jgi:hypothetical protein
MKQLEIQDETVSCRGGCYIYACISILGVPICLLYKFNLQFIQEKKNGLLTAWLLINVLIASGGYVQYYHRSTIVTSYSSRRGPNQPH